MKFHLNVSRCSDGRIYIELVDALDRSGVHFFRGSLTAEAFGNAVTGLSLQDIHGELRDTECVGKVRVTEPRTVVCPIRSWDRALLQDWLKQNCQEEGWLLDAYLGSQGSVGTDGDGRTVLRYRVIKYVDPPKDGES